MKKLPCKQLGKAASLGADTVFPFIPAADHFERKQRPMSTLTAMVHTIAMAGALGLFGVDTIHAATNVPTDLSPSPLFGALPFSQQMLRFEEFGTKPLSEETFSTVSSLPSPVPPSLGFTPCNSPPDTNALDTFLEADLYPAPMVEANISLPNPWNTDISPCIGSAITGVIEGRPPGVHFAHQRAVEFSPQVYFQSAQVGSRINGGIRDGLQLHDYNAGEFASSGLYHNTVGVPGFDGKTENIEIKFHPSMPVQDHLALWTFDGTLPPKLLMARYGVPTLFRHYNALPIDLSANHGFGEHTITTHEHNGHQPGESDGFAFAYFFPGEFWDYRWPLQLAGYDFINTDEGQIVMDALYSWTDLIRATDVTSQSLIAIADAIDELGFGA